MLKTINFITIFFYCLSISVFCELKSHTITITSQGLVRGYEDPEDGIYVFYNVPYATVPKGPNRFKAPLPAPVWEGTFEAVDRRIVCPQSNQLGILPKDKIKDEDCLVANIYIPNTDARNLPVVVYSHGGGFVVGWGDLFTFKKMVKSQKVIIVSFNYRLAAHGFLCLGTKDAPGNAGMKDQVALLRWVRDNIKSFGGNPDDVTLHGCSAGSSSVELLMLSKMANGLFKRVIADSGAGISTFTVQTDPIENARKYAKLLGYGGKEDVYSLELFYKNLSYDKLNSVQVVYNTDFVLLMTPCVERNVGEEMFLDDSPMNILKNGNYNKTPMLYGFTNMEGIFRLGQFSIWKDEMNANFSNFLPDDLHFKDHREKELVANNVKQFYFGNKLIGEETILSFVDYYTDIFIAYGMMKAVNLQLEAGNDQIYLYEYSYFDNDTEFIPYTNVRGSNHCSQTFAVMDGFYNFVSVPYNEKYVSNDMLKMKGVMRKIWGNFIKTGHPITDDSDLDKWAPISCRWSELMSINRTIQIKKSFATKRAIFWDKIYEKYYFMPQPPPIPPPKETSNDSSKTVVKNTVLSEISDGVESRLVRISSGAIRGYKDPQEDVFVFYGIPYAKAPTGTDRFKAPLPPPIWFNTLDAVDMDIVCPQMSLDILPKKKNMKEDCLIANVYIPETEDKNLPVVVYVHGSVHGSVHGGGFIVGFGDFITPKKLVSSKKIIVVTFNYRLGAHGFLCLGTEDIPGNAAMKDQVALLRWVKKNIASFGGNPNDVTIAGYSTGSTCVELLMISKMAEGLFHKVILESGASISPFSVQIDPIQNAKEYARLIGYNNIDDLYKIENYYKEASYEILQSGHVNLMNFTVLIAPCVERDIRQEIFLKDSPVNILKQGNYLKLPMLYGFAELEGLMRIPDFEIWKKEINEDFSKLLPADLNFKTQNEKNVARNMIKEFYFGFKPIDNNTILEFVEYLSDITLGCPTLRAIHHLVKSGHNEVYLYQYSYTDENTPVVPNTKVRGANHCDQTNIVLDGINATLNKESVLSEDYLNMQIIMRELWGNFIINRKPSASGIPVWQPVGKNWSPHMVLKKNAELKGSLLEKRCRFWDKIYDSYYKSPLPPLTLPRQHSEL